MRASTARPEVRRLLDATAADLMTTPVTTQKHFSGPVTAEPPGAPTRGYPAFGEAAGLYVLQA